MMPVASCIPFPFFAPCDVMLIMLVCATHWLFMHLCTLAYMFMHKSCLLVSHPCFKAMKLWTFDLNLHLSPVNTTYCLPFLLVCLLACLLAFLFLCLPCLSCLFALCLYHMPPFPLHVHIWSKNAWSKGTISQVQAKRERMQACRYKLMMPRITPVSRTVLEHS